MHHLIVRRGVGGALQKLNSLVQQTGSFGVVLVFTRGLHGNSARVVVNANQGQVAGERHHRR
jgi:hypothetical protein